METERELVESLRTQLARTVARFRPGREDVRRFHERLQATLESVKADGSPLTMVEHTGSAIAEAETPFEACAHLAVLEVYARVTASERLLRYTKLVSDVTRILAAASAGSPPSDADPVAHLRLAGKTISAVAAMDRDEPRSADARLLAFAGNGGVAAEIAAVILQMLAEVRGEVPS